MGKILLITLLLTMHSLVQADTSHSVKTGRYSSVTNVPPVEQQEPLRVILKTTIPQGVRTVGGAIEYLLVRSGYSLVSKSKLSVEAQKLMTLDLPQVHRRLGPISLDVALQTLSG